MTMTAPRRVLTLDSEDRKLVAYVHAYRNAHGTGPTWSEVRAAVGLAQLHPWREYVGQAREELGPDATDAQVRQRAHQLYRQQVDPLAAWLVRLKASGAVIYTKAPRSLDVTSKVATAIERGRGGR